MNDSEKNRPLDRAELPSETRAEEKLPSAVKGAVLQIRSRIKAGARKQQSE